MKKILLILTFSISFVANLHGGVLEDSNKDPQLLVALELTYNCRDKDTAFSACSMALEKHKADAQCVLFITELMVRCPISSKFEEEMQLAADYVVKNSSDPLFLGIAWHRKAEHSYKNVKFNECISYCDIALKNLQYDAGKCEDGNLSNKAAYEIFILIRKLQCFRQLGQSEKAIEVEKILMNYPAYVRYINKNPNNT